MCTYIKKKLAGHGADPHGKKNMADKKTCDTLEDCGGQYTAQGCLLSHNNKVYKLWDNDGELTYAETLLDNDPAKFNTSEEWNLDNGMFKLQVNGYDPQCLDENGEVVSDGNEATCESNGHQWIGGAIPKSAVAGVPKCTTHPELCSDGQCERTDSVNHKASLDAGCLARDNNTVYLLNREKQSTVTLQASADTAWFDSCLENASEIRDPTVLGTQFCTNPTCTDATTGELVEGAASKDACDTKGGTWGDDACRTLVGECTDLSGDVVDGVRDKAECEGNNATWTNAKCTGEDGSAVPGVYTKAECIATWQAGLCSNSSNSGLLATSKTECVTNNRTWKPSTWAQFYCSNAAPCAEEDVPGGVNLTEAQQIRLHASKNNPAAIEALCKLNANLCSKFTEGAVSTNMCAADPLGCAKTIVDPVGRCEYLPKTQGCPFIPPLPSEKDVVRLHFEDQTLGFEKKRKKTIFSVGGAVAFMVVGVIALIIYDRVFSSE